MKLALLLALAGCFADAPGNHSISNQVDRTATHWELGERGIGRVTADSEATTVALQRLLPSVRVTDVNLGGGSGRVFNVYDATDKLFYIVPDDANPSGETDGQQDGDRRYAKTIFAIFVTSPRVKVEGKPWRVGFPLDNAADITSCECWGSGEVTACWTHAAHIRLIFETRCEDATKLAGHALVGKKIGRIMWKRDPNDSPAGP